MKKCSNCGNEKLMVSVKESKLIRGAKYAACTDCGNMMILINGLLLPTPTEDSPRTKLLIQDASDCFDSLMSLGGVASLDGKTTPIEIQPIQTLEHAQKYIEDQLYLHMTHVEEEDYEEYIDDQFSCDEECDRCSEGCPDFDEKKAEAIANGQPVYQESKTMSAAVDMSGFPVEEINVTEVKPSGNYLLLLPNGEKQLYMNTSKGFIINIINDIDTDFSLFELKLVDIKSEVKYSF